MTRLFTAKLIILFFGRLYRVTHNMAQGWVTFDSANRIGAASICSSRRFPRRPLMPPQTHAIDSTPSTIAQSS